jgi:hypothetical protein
METFKIGDWVTVLKIYSDGLSEITKIDYYKLIGQTFQIIGKSGCFYYVWDNRYSFLPTEIQHATKQEIETAKQRLMAALV